MNILAVVLQLHRFGEGRKHHCFSN